MEQQTNRKHMNNVQKDADHSRLTCQPYTLFALLLVVRNREDLQYHTLPVQHMPGYDFKNHTEHHQTVVGNKNNRIVLVTVL